MRRSHVSSYNSIREEMVAEQVRDVLTGDPHACVHSHHSRAMSRPRSFPVKYV